MQSAFAGCDGLKRITVSESVKEIGNMVFFDCGALTDIDYHGSKGAWETIKKDKNWIDRKQDFTVHCTDGDLSNLRKPKLR